MTGPSGFVERYKGKAAFDAGSSWVKGTPIYGPASVQTISTLAAANFPNSSVVDGSTIVNYGVTIIASSASAVATMQAPAYIGQYKVILLSTLVTGVNLFLRMGTTATTLINGSTFWVIKSTIGNSALEFTAYSTAGWALAGVQNSSATHTLSTTT